MRIVIIGKDYLMYNLSEKQLEQMEHFLDSTSWYSKISKNILKVDDLKKVEAFFDYMPLEPCEKETSPTYFFEGSYEVFDVKDIEEFNKYCTLHESEFRCVPTLIKDLFVRI